MIRIILGSLAMATACPALSAPLELLDSGHPVTEVSLNDQNGFRFVIDTAASASAVTPDLVRKRPAIFGKGNVAQLAGAAGQVGITTLRVSSLSVDGKQHSNLVVAALPPSPVDKLGVDGILGADVLAGHVVDLDLANGKWSLSATLDPAVTGQFPSPIPFTFSQGRAPVVPVTLNGKELRAILDTGAKGTIMNWAAARLLGLDKKDVLKDGAPVGGATGSAADVRSTTVPELTLGSVTRTSMKVRIADLPVFQASGFKPDEPVVLLGIDAFANGRLIVDYPGMRLFHQAGRS
ncbi:clan AA aspartic protease [Sphingomonas sp. HDW15A]|uniref:retropepsin-like aspartic protease n=1 Tax=Sphingomonas sp. HDW15A TaxID=2714942 RepID=UPI001407F889|nr:retropepsin-like aspartic protease [Sphingomonas sp. HDW15A]QIK95313.1 clan AA aspartic protease [Sphingomonas sp. HDW15A]